MRNSTSVSSGWPGAFPGSAGQRAGAAGQGAAPVGRPSSEAPQRLGPARPRPLHPRAAHGGDVRLSGPATLPLGLWAAQTPFLPFKALVPVRGRPEGSCCLPLSPRLPLSLSEAVTLSWALPASLSRRPHCLASGLLACPQAAPFSPPAHSSSRRADVEAGLTSSGVVSQLPPRGRPSHLRLQTQRRARAPRSMCLLLPQARPWSPEVSGPLGSALRNPLESI